MKKYAALLLLCLTLSAPAFARTSPRRHAPKTQYAVSVWHYVLQAIGLAKAETLPPPPPVWPIATTEDGSCSIDPNGCTKPKP